MVWFPSDTSEHRRIPQRKRLHTRRETSGKEAHEEIVVCNLRPIIVILLVVSAVFDVVNTDTEVLEYLTVLELFRAEGGAAVIMHGPTIEVVKHQAL